MSEKSEITTNRENEKKELQRSLLLSGVVHVLLFIGLFTVFQWQTQSETVYAELWAPEDISSGNDPNGVAKKFPDEEPDPQARPQDDPQEAQKAVAAKTQLEETLKREELQREQARQEELAKVEEARKAAEEQKRQEEARRVQEEQRKAEEAKLEKERQDAIAAEQERQRKEAERQAKEKLEQERRKADEEAKQKAAEEAAKKQAEKERQERERIRAAMRQQELARLNAKSDPNGTRSGTTKGDKNNVRQNLSGSAYASYNARVVACIRPNINIDVNPTVRRGQYVAEYSVSLLPTGERVGTPKQLKSSGWTAYDRAVESAIIKCQPFPKPEAGFAVPRDLKLTFDPVDDKR